MLASTQNEFITSIDMYATQTNASTKLGSKATTVDGRTFRYAKNGGVAGVLGELQQTAAEDTNFQQMAVEAAASAGATTIAVTLGGTSTTSGMFNEGILVVSTTPGIGQSFKIVTHDVATNGTTCNFTIDQPLTVALTTSSKVSVMKNPYDSVIKAPTTQTGAPVGGMLVAAAASAYFYLQTGGAGVARCDATVTSAANMGLSPSVTTAGDVTKAVTLSTRVGRSMTAVTISATPLPLIWELD